MSNYTSHHWIISDTYKGIFYVLSSDTDQIPDAFTDSNRYRVNPIPSQGAEDVQKLAEIYEKMIKAGLSSSATRPGDLT